MKYREGMYFRNEAEADDWLDFEADEWEIERRAFTDSDRFAEWREWRADWLLHA